MSLTNSNVASNSNILDNIASIITINEEGIPTVYTENTLSVLKAGVEQSVSLLVTLTNGDVIKVVRGEFAENVNLDQTYPTETLTTAGVGRLFKKAIGKTLSPSQLLDQEIKEIATYTKLEAQRRKLEEKYRTVEDTINLDQTAPEKPTTVA